MKLPICLLTFSGCLALLSAHLSQDRSIGENVYFEPRSNYMLDGRIIGGEEAVPHSRPYHVGILIDGRTLCSGSLISPNYVLTAAHCTINASYVDLIFGAHNVNIQEPTQLRVTSSVIINHPDYGNTTTYSNDIALIKTPTPIVTNNNIKLVRLPPANAASYEHSFGALSGWGTTSDSSSSISPLLRVVHLVILDYFTCLVDIRPNVYERTNLCTSGRGNVGACHGDFGSPLVVSDTQESNLCTSGKGKVGACNGDSGSPLVVRNTQVGIVSYVSTNVCESGHPTVYTRVSFYRKWINENSDL